MADEGVPGESEFRKLVLGLTAEGYAYFSSLTASDLTDLQAKCATARTLGSSTSAWVPLDIRRASEAWADKVTGALQAVPFFSALEEAVVDAMASSLEVRQFADGEAVCTVGEEADGLYIVIDGKADVKVDGVTVHTYAAGESFGEEAMITKALQPATSCVRNASILAAAQGTGTCNLSGVPATVDSTTCLRLATVHFQRLDPKAVKIGRAMSKMAVKSREQSQASAEAACAAAVESVPVSTGWSKLRDLPGMAADSTAWAAIGAAVSSIAEFASLDSGAIRGMSEQLDVRKFGGGQAIVTEGDEADGLYIIWSGNAHVIKDGSVVHKYTERACFGEKAMMAEADDWLEVATRAATVQAVEPGATCMRLTNTAFHSLDKVKEALESSGA